MRRMIINKRAQSTLEYIVVFSALILALIWAAQNLITPAMKNAMNSTGEALEEAGAKIAE